MQGAVPRQGAHGRVPRHGLIQDMALGRLEGDAREGDYDGLRGAVGQGLGQGRQDRELGKNDGMETCVRLE